MSGGWSKSGATVHNPSPGRAVKRRVRNPTSEEARILSRITILERRIQMCDALFRWPAYIQTFEEDVRQLKLRLKVLGHDPHLHRRTNSSVKSSNADIPTLPRF